MTSNEEHQSLEIQALKSIYNDLLFDSSPPKAWKGAARLPEFNVKILHPIANSIFVTLNVKFPKLYPLKSPPFLAITEYRGPTPAQVNKIVDLIHSEAQRHIGEETIFSIILAVEEWFKTNIPAPKEPSGLSLAIEMQNRALEQEKEMKEREALHARAADEMEAKRVKELMEQIEQGKEEMQRLARERQKVKQRALSDSTEKPAIGPGIETFDEEIDAYGLRFKSVRFFHGRRDCLGIIYDAEPMLDEAVDSVTLELHVISFESNYYKMQQGKKKIDQVLNELRRIMTIANDFVQKVYAAHIDVSKTNVTRLSILMEKRPAITFDIVLRECEGFREDRVMQYLSQICSGLSAIHDSGLVHRAMTPASIGLFTDNANGGNTIKLLRTAIHVKLHDLHRSEPFGPDAHFDSSDLVLPDNWLWPEAIESPLLYTRGRDMHGIGIIALQMLMGLDVIQDHLSPRAAMQDCDFSPCLTQIIADCLRLGKKGSIPDAADIPGRLSRDLLHMSSRTTPIAIRTKTSSANDVKTPLARSMGAASSPDMSLLMEPMSRFRKASRWREDWDELDTLGKGGFGSVVKARNRLDNRVYAVKKIKLRTSQSDNKIFREVNALSRLSHRFIVRYYTTWLEETEPTASNVSSDSERDGFDPLGEKTAGVALQMTRTISTDTDSFEDPRIFDLNDLVLEDNSQAMKSFPSIHFTSGDVASDDSDEEDVSSMRMAEKMQHKKVEKQIAQRFTERTLYIQMEYVANQTLKERIGEGITEDEAWRLFQQIVDALVHMASLGIIHRDIKLTNIFIDSNGDCKVGDFGLATSSLAAVDPSDVSFTQMVAVPDMTLDVGTRLYIAPEILSKRGSRSKDHSKADLYSLGIVFFEMNYMFSTVSERISVIESLRLPDIFFPIDWEVKRTVQREIIQSLLEHDLDKRPTALQLSQSPLLPPRVEDDYFKEALQTMTNRKNRYYPAVVGSLFQQEPNPVREHIYDQDLPESSTLRHTVAEHLERLFHLHGARHVDIPLLMPLNQAHREDQRQVLFIDTHGEIVTLPSTGLVPFARLAARTGVTRIKRYNIMDTYRGGNLLGHPHVSTAAIFDIITPDTVYGSQVASAEMLALMDECLNTFPYLKTYQAHVSHSKISELVMTRIPEKLRTAVVDVVQMKANFSQKRLSWQKKGLSKVMIDDLEWLCDDYEDISAPLMRMEKISSPLAESIAPLLQEIGRVISLAVTSGLSCTVRIKPLMVGRRHDPFKNGVCFEIIGGEKRSGILAVGGRYDHLIRQFAPPSSGEYQQYAKKEAFVAVGVQIATERITTAIASFQCDFLSNPSNQRIYDYWSDRRCDVYIVSFQPGHLSTRLEIAALLWRHGISADLMYETGLSDTTMEGLADLCYHEGVLFTLYPKMKFGQREVIEFKVKSVLRGTEYEVSRSDLIPWLQQHIAEQKRLDLALTGVTGLSADIASASIPGIKESHSDHDVQVVLPGEGVSVKKQRKTTRQLFFERAYEKRMRLKAATQSSSLPMLAVDVPPAMFDALIRSDNWVTDDDSWRALIASFSHQYAGYINQIREAVLRRKNEGIDFMILFAVKEERLGLLNFRSGNEH